MVYEYGKVEREREKKSTIISRDATLGKAAAASSSRERRKNTSGDSPSSSATASKKKKKQHENPSLVCTPWPEDLRMRSMGKRGKGRGEEEEEGRKEGRKERRGVVD